MSMTRRIVNAKIFNPIIKPVSVFMMNNLVFLKRATNMFAHNKPMLKDITLFVLHKQISVGVEIFATFPFVVFGARAKLLRKLMFISVFVDGLPRNSQLFRDFFSGLAFFIKEFFEKFWIEFPHIKKKDISLTTNSQTIYTLL